MAEITKRISEDFLCCKLCNDHFKDPRILPCLHTFCKTCIGQNIRNQHTKNEKHLVCPLCSKTVGLSHQVKDDLAETFPANILVADIADAVHVLTSKNVKCQPCSRKGNTGKATTWCRSCKESLCDECLNFHQSLKQTMKHPLLSMKELKNKDLKEVMAIPTCPIHGEELTQFCEDHNSVICTVCTATSHRTCRSVLGLHDALKLRRKELQGLQYKLDEQEKGASSLYNDRQAMHTHMNTKLQSLAEEIKSVRTKIDTKLEQCEKEILQELEAVQSSENNKMEENVQEAENILKATNNTNEVLKHASMAGDAHLLQWLEGIKGETEAYSIGLRSVVRNKTQMPTIDFAINYQLDNVLRTVSNIGELVVDMSPLHGLPKNRAMSFDNLKKRKPSFDRRLSRDSNISIDSIINSRQSRNMPRSVASSIEHERNLSRSEFKQQTLHTVHSARSPSDATACWLTGLAIMPSGLTVCTDKNNKKVKVFDTNFKLVLERILKSEPFDIAALNSSNAVAVTVPDEHKIEIFSMMHGVNPIRSIKMTEKCYGIAYTPGKFAISCIYSNPPLIKIITEDGSEVQDIKPNNGYQSLFMKPSYLTWDSNGVNLYISDSKKDHTLCMSGSRLKIFTYHEATLSSPRGVTLGNDDSFYVCGWATDNIHLVDKYGNFKAECLNRHDGIIGPQRVCFDKDTRRIVVSLDTTSCNSDNIFVFTL